MIAVDTVDGFKARAHTTIRLTFAEPIAPALFEAVPAVTAVQATGDRTLHLRVVGPVDEVLGLASTHAVTSIATEDADLEEAFLGYYAGEDDES